MKLAIGNDHVAIEMKNEITAYPEGKGIVDEWLAAEYEGGRHQIRVDMIAEIEGAQKLEAAGGQ